MSVLRARDVLEPRHPPAAQDPTVISGDVFVLLFIILFCGYIWYTAFRNKPQHHAFAEEVQMPQNQSLGRSIEWPFTIRQLNRTTWLIRENDRFGEHPHIYVKKHTESLPDGRQASILIVTDTGCGTSLPNPISRTGKWNIKTFIDQHLNPHGDIPYLVILSHCHYDHILGLNPILQPAKEAGEAQSRRTLIMSSGYNRSFLEPRSQLREHSLCASMDLQCPSFKTTLWAPHNERITVTHPKFGLRMHLPITTLHTPGHTPDSLTWYDEDERVLYIGDSFYEQESPDSQNAPWGREKPAPILFPNEGNLMDWWRCVNMLIAFVEEKNEEEGREKVMLSAGHVTVGVDALACLLDVKEFMRRVLANEVPFEERPRKRGERFGFWSEEGGRFSLGAPLSVIQGEDDDSQTGLVI